MDSVNINYNILNTQLVNEFLDFISSNNIQAKQGTQQWLDERKFSFGGSEMAGILSQNKYKSRKETIIEKVMNSLRPCINNHYMAWGTLFEPVHRKYMEEILQVKIYETGAIPCSQTKYHKYSPDGLCQITKEQLQKLFPDNKILNQIETGEITVLIEQKVVTTRRMIQNSIPDYYLPQVKSGLVTIPITQLGLYTECQFLIIDKCDLLKEKLTNSAYNVFDRKVINTNQYETDKYCHKSKQRGIIRVYSYDEDYVKEWKKKLLGIDHIDNTNIQALQVDRNSLLDAITQWVKDPKIVIDRESFYGTDFQQNILYDDQHLILEIPWIIKQDNFLLIEKDNMYLQDNMQLIESAGDFLHKAHEYINTKYDNFEQRQNLLNSEQEQNNLQIELSILYDQYE